MRQQSTEINTSTQTSRLDKALGFQNQYTRNFQKVTDLFFGPAGLSFAEVISAGRIQRIFAKHSCLFGMKGVYTTAVMVWSFLGQVLHDGKEASCQAAVARVVTHCQLLTSQTPPTSGTGNYCRARAKLSTPKSELKRELRKHCT